MVISKAETQNLVRRSKLFVPVNREKFVEKAWIRDADCIILDLEDSIASADKVSARKMVKDVIPIVNKGGAEIQVRINREYEEEDLDAVMVSGLDIIMIPKCESAAEIQHIDEMVTQLEKERGFPAGKIQFDLLIESAQGVVNLDDIAKASQRIAQMNIGQGDLSVDMEFPRQLPLNFEQYVYAENRLLFAARAAKVQPCGLGAQNHVDFTSVSMGEEAMFKACLHAQWLGYKGSIIIHPGWIKAVNEGFKPAIADLKLALKIKKAMDEAQAQGKASVAVDGRMYDLANMKYVNYIVARSQAVANRESIKEAAVAAARSFTGEVK
jgi:citrate lyase subunit beta / citryl-CoA lyase